MNRSTSLFNQLLQQFPRSEFKRLVNKHQAEKGAKGFTSWPNPGDRSPRLPWSLRMNLFTYKDLLGWLHDPFKAPPMETAAGAALPGVVGVLDSVQWAGQKEISEKKAWSRKDENRTPKLLTCHKAVAKLVPFETDLCVTGLARKLFKE